MSLFHKEPSTQQQQSVFKPNQMGRDKEKRERERKKERQGGGEKGRDREIESESEREIERDRERKGEILLQNFKFIWLYMAKVIYY